MSGNCNGVKCAFRRDHVCTHMILTGKPRGCPPGKECTRRALELPLGLLRAEEDQNSAFCVPSERTLRKRANHAKTRKEKQSEN